MKLRARKKINEKINEKLKLTDRQKMVIDYILNHQFVNALDIAGGLNIPKGSVFSSFSWVYFFDNTRNDFDRK